MSYVFFQTSKSELVSACVELGVSSEGSTTDLINRLEELLLYKEIYPKMFVKLQKTGGLCYYYNFEIYTYIGNNLLFIGYFKKIYFKCVICNHLTFFLSGGVLHAGCPHSVVYCCSPLWWQESARDHVDALLSCKSPPTIYVSDVAGQVARHANNRTRQRFFRPFDGRLCEATEENLDMASKKDLHVNFPWLKLLKQGGPTQNVGPADGGDVLERPHPITGTSDRYSLYDRFHQRNQKRIKEKLRSLDLLPELIGYINSSVAEQLNKELANSRYFLCQLKDMHFMFMLRLVFHLHNQRVNMSFMKKMLRQTDGATKIGLDGRLCLYGEGMFYFNVD